MGLLLCGKIWSCVFVCRGSRVGDDSLGDLAHVHKQQREGKDPAEVVPGKVQPGVMMDLYL